MEAKVVDRPPTSYMAPPLQLPGYAFDSATNRYYKLPKGQAAPLQSRPSSTSSIATREESDGRKRKRARKTVEKGKWRAAESVLWGLREMSTGGDLGGNVGEREKLHQYIPFLPI
jgi:hypothetical protein